MARKLAGMTWLEMSEGAALITCSAGQKALESTGSKTRVIHAALTEETKRGWDYEVTRLRAWALAHECEDIIEETIRLADKARERFKAFVTLGIGGSDLGQRTIHDALNAPNHNLLVAGRQNAPSPEVYFAGNTFDPRRLVSLLDMLEARGLLAHTVFNVVSKSGRTSETISAMLLARDRLIAAHDREGKRTGAEGKRAGAKPGAEAWRQNIIATTGPDPATSVLRRMHGESPFFGILPIPDGIGGRFSVVSPVGLLFLGVTAQKEAPGKRINQAIAGLRAAHRMFLSPPSHPSYPSHPSHPSHLSSANPACDLAAWLHLAETRCHRNAIVFYNYADTPCIGEWFLQLYTESLQERNAGLSVTAVTGPTGNHSILNGIIGGPRDRVVLVVAWDNLGAYDPATITIPTKTGIGGELEAFEGVPLDKAQAFSLAGTVADFTENGVPNVTLRVARRDTQSLFCLLRVLMDTVAVKGRLQDLHVAPQRAGCVSGELTYQQDGVEGYKKKTLALAKEWKGTR